MKIKTLIAGISLLVLAGQGFSQICDFDGRLKKSSAIGGFLDGVKKALGMPQDLPDLAPDAEAMAQSLEVSRRRFEPSDCAVAEGCVDAPGERVLLKFDAAILNLGKADLVVGDPGRRPDLFVFSPCHNHYHLPHITELALLSKEGETVLRKRKHAFCLLDIRDLRRQGRPRRYTCSNQGISAGWADVYAKSLPCQWLDVTGVPPGDYVLEMAVNPDGKFAESSRANNVARVPVHLPQI